jgi:hypothetical protein
MERGKRIELSALAWKAKVLPLYEPRIKNMVPRRRLELPRLSALASKTSVSTIPPPGHIETLCLVLSVPPHEMVGIECFYMVPVAGFELATY